MGSPTSSSTKSHDSSGSMPDLEFSSSRSSPPLSATTKSQVENRDQTMIDSIIRCLKNVDKRKLSENDKKAKTAPTVSRTPFSKVTASTSDKLTKNKISFLLGKVSKIFLKEETLVEVAAPVIICGDIHGQYADVLNIMDRLGYPPETRYLFLGDYVDRGDQSLELACFLILLKIQYPTDIYLLRGNHETAEVNSVDGFKNDCLNEFDINIWELFQECFKCLPLAGLVGGKIIAMHGGISSAFNVLEDLKKIPRPVEVPDNGLVCDLLWSDPLPDELHSDKKNCGFTFNTSRNTSVYFCSHVLDEFLKRNNLELLVRGHELFESGYKFSPKETTLTLFTAPCYCGGNNDAAVLFVDDKLRYYVKTFRFAPQIPTKVDSEPFVDEKTKRERKKDAETALRENNPKP